MMELMIKIKLNEETNEYELSFSRENGVHGHMATVHSSLIAEEIEDIAYEWLDDTDAKRGAL